MSKIAIDANLLLLLVVGKASKNFIAKHKRLKAFTRSRTQIILATLHEQ